MKVITAGFVKTGSKSMAAALTKLGYSVYDFEQHFEYLGDEWLKIFRKGGTKEDFRRMYENVDAGTDVPFTIFWEEIADAFPDAKRAPKDRLLVFNLEDGWGPLCEFLGKDIPDAPFPHENVKGEIIARSMKANPLFDRMKHEMMISFGMFGIVSCFIAYRFLKPMIKF